MFMLEDQMSSHALPTCLHVDNLELVALDGRGQVPGRGTLLEMLLDDS